MVDGYVGGSIDTNCNRIEGDYHGPLDIATVSKQLHDFGFQFLVNDVPR